MADWRGSKLTEIRAEQGDSADFREIAPSMR